MENKLQIFNNTNFGEIRTLIIDNEPYFVANDLCNALGYEKPRNAVAQHVDEDDALKQGVSTPIVSHGVNTGKTKKINMIVVNESGMYSLIFGSKLPQAKEFKRWVTSEVLPAIRKHGAYLTAPTLEELLLNPDTIYKLASKLKEEQEEKLYYQGQAELSAERIKEIEPKAEFFDQLMQSESLLLTDQIAKELGMTAVRLNRKLEELGVQFKRGLQWVLTAKYANNGYTKTKTYIYTKRDGTMESTVRTVWTERGRLFIHQLVKDVTKHDTPCEKV